MRLLRCWVNNFGSYGSFDIDFSNQGLALICGKTGSGKSTIPDVPSWILYGRTAKDGNADDVKSWFATEPTEGTISVELNAGETIDVTRIRGIKAGTNDLFWIESKESEGSPIRGKDLVETQKLLETRLGVSFEAYISGSYYHEFSPVGLFFSTSAKQRRQVFEGLANMATAITLAEKSSLAKKRLKADLRSIQSERDKLAGTAEHIEENIKVFKEKSETFEKDKKEKIATLEKKDQEWLKRHSQYLDNMLNDLDALNKEIALKDHYDGQLADLEGQIHNIKQQKCSTCGGPKSSNHLETLQLWLSTLKDNKRNNLQKISEFNTLFEAVKREQNIESPYLEQIRQAEAEQNQYGSMADKATINLRKARSEHKKISSELNDANHKYTSLDTLYELSYRLRGSLLTRIVEEIETRTNQILTSSFDGEFRIGFSIEGADNLEVSIIKNGHPCVYKQLSKGQRQLLRLSFVTTVMEASANRYGCHFSTLFFDEALDGLDSDLKIKAFSLFQQLQLNHESIFIIDHTPEFQALFTNKYQVSMENDISTIICQ